MSTDTKVSNKWIHRIIQRELKQRPWKGCKTITKHVWFTLHSEIISVKNFHTTKKIYQESPQRSENIFLHNFRWLDWILIQAVPILLFWLRPLRKFLSSYIRPMAITCSTKLLANRWHLCLIYIGRAEFSRCGKTLSI